MLALSYYRHAYKVVVVDHLAHPRPFWGYLRHHQLCVFATQSHQAWGNVRFAMVWHSCNGSPIVLHIHGTRCHWFRYGFCTFRSWCSVEDIPLSLHPICNLFHWGVVVDVIPLVVEFQYIYTTGKNFGYPRAVHHDSWSRLTTARSMGRPQRYSSNDRYGDAPHACHIIW